MPAVRTPDDGIIRTPNVFPHSRYATAGIATFVIGRSYLLRLDGRNIHRYLFIGTEEGGSMRWIDQGRWHPTRAPA